MLLGLPSHRRPICYLSLGRPTSRLFPGTNHPSSTQVWNQGIWVGGGGKEHKSSGPGTRAHGLSSQTHQQRIRSANGGLGDKSERLATSQSEDP